MGDGTKIEWTDATWNPITGCSLVSPGCTNCYAMRLAGTRLAHHPSRAGLTRDTKTGPVWTGEVRLNEQWLTQPLKWKRPRRIFVCAHGDLFAEGVPDEWIDKVFAVMALAPQHIFQVLTKRPERMREYFTKPVQGAWAGRAFSIGEDGIKRDMTDARMRVSDALLALFHRAPAAQLNLSAEMQEPYGDGFMPRWPLPHVWLGVSVEDQRRAEERIPILLETPAAVRWVSAEPLLGPLSLRNICGRLERMPERQDHFDALHPRLTPRLNWIVVGGESGPGARVWPGFEDAARSIRDQCKAAGVPFFFKQMQGARKSAMPPIPPDLIVREFPNA